ncbi:uncharacterized protein E0L32_006137 [Thyridium curvatum]|uniref:G-patch domain-containing protein n=1 Tax=Thyridium curvatum TaxID=1093900 RepID=A0A507B100_9PEZI|nr:uncharacterized protein E0L32_006137 [Thyridium curvatum]TPX13407.1 hypothetical protein E0L32_006137 [Thyridium curvatum]
MASFQGFSGSFKLSKAEAEDMSSSDSDNDSDEFQLPSTDPNADEFADYNPRKRRRTGRDAKESAALGIFGSESEDDRGPRRWKKKTLRNKGVSFVSGGQQAATGSDQENEDDEESEEDGKFYAPGLGAYPQDKDELDDEDEEESTRGVGLGFSSSAAQGLGAAPSAQRQLFANFTRPNSSKPAFSKSKKPKYDANNPLGRGFMPSSANEPVLKVTEDQDDAPKVARPSAFSSSAAKKGKTKVNPNSFGARMMAKMGYVAGEGLGKEGQGRNIVIEANLRPQGAGLGAVKEKSEQEKQEEKRQARLRGEVVIDSDEEEKKRKAARWKKALAGGVGSGGVSSGTSTPKRQKAKYMTMDEVKKAAPGLNIPDAFTPILDLTGPGKKMLTSSSGLMTPTSGTPTSESTEQAESRKLARRAQNDFLAILEEWQSLQNRKAYADLQMQQEKQELEELELALNGHQSTVNAFKELTIQDGEQGWEERWNKALSQLRTVLDSVPEDSIHAMRDELPIITVAALHPLFKEAMQTWEPLEDPKPRLVEDLVSIKQFLGLQDGVKSHRKSIATPYETMMYKIWLPHVARAVREWNVREVDQLLVLFEAWQGLLPEFVRGQLLEQDILRKLDDALAKWEPKRKKHHNLPHLWLFPWLQYLPTYHLDPKSSTGLVAEVKRKFRQLIDVWEFYRGVIPGLKQWKEVLRPSRDNDQWRPLVMNNILPSMARYVKAQFQVDARDQEPFLEVLTGEWQWLELMSPSMIGEVMVAEMFPMWHEALYRMLTAENPNYDEIIQWYSWWVEEVFPEELRSLPSISAEFEKGTVLINEALDLGSRARSELEHPQKGPALGTKTERESRSKGHSSSSHGQHRRHHHHEQQPAAKTATHSKDEPEEMSIRHFVEEWCENNDLQFIPERKKVHEQGPLYRITSRGDGRGGVLTYFKGIRLYAETKKGPLEIRVDREEDWMRLLELAQ